MGGHLSPPLNVTDTLCRQRGKGVKYLRGVSCPPHHSAKTKTQTSEHAKICKQKQTSMQTGKGVKYLRDLSSTQCKHKQPNTVTHKLKQANTKTKYKQTIKHSKVSSVAMQTQHSLCTCSHSKLEPVFVNHFQRGIEISNVLLAKSRS